MWMRGGLASLREQHILDLHTYRQQHQCFGNRILHWVFIPVETIVFLFFIAFILEKIFKNHQPDGVHLFLLSVGWTLGITSVLISTNQHRMTGFASCLFHVWSCRWISAQLATIKRIHDSSRQNRIVLALLLAWIMAWSLQVGIGHWLIEENKPNMTNNLQEVSYLAMTQSVLIAWSS